MAPSKTKMQGDMFSLGRNDLKAIAAGRGKRAQAAQAELDRRTHNRQVKSAAKASA